MTVDETAKFTQADVDRIVSERLQREREKYSDYEAIKAENATLKTSLAAEQSERKTLVDKLAAREDSDLKVKIAKEVNLPEKLIPLITGKTEDEIRTAMKLMVDSIGPGPAMGAGTNPATPAPHRFTKAEVDRMSPEDITKNWATIEAQLKDGSLHS
jgi:hypothetical protein